MSRREGLLSLRPRSACLSWACSRASFWPWCCPCSGSWPPPCGPKDAVLGRLARDFKVITASPTTRRPRPSRACCSIASAPISSSSTSTTSASACGRRSGSAASPVAWVIVDLSPVSFVDATAVQRFDELREELEARGVAWGRCARSASWATASRRDGWRSAGRRQASRFPDPSLRGSGFRGSFGTAPERRSWCRLRCGDPGRPRRRGPDCSGERYAA